MICLLFGQYWEKLDNFLFYHLITLIRLQNEINIICAHNYSCHLQALDFHTFHS